MEEIKRLLEEFPKKILEKIPGGTSRKKNRSTEFTVKRFHEYQEVLKEEFSVEFFEECPVKILEKFMVQLLEGSSDEILEVFAKIFLHKFQD